MVTQTTTLTLIKECRQRFFYTGDASEDSFPSSYEILVLDAEDKGTPGFKWNHGNSYGVAIDSSASEIVYWAEQW